MLCTSWFVQSAVLLIFCESYILRFAKIIAINNLRASRICEAPQQYRKVANMSKFLGGCVPLTAPAAAGAGAAAASADFC